MTAPRSVPDDARELRLVKVPLEPPSVNHYKLPNRGGGWRLSEAAQAFKDAVCILARQRNPLPKCSRYGVSVWYVLNETTRIDIDNAAKLVLDGLEASGLIANDSHVLDLAQHKRRTHNLRNVTTDIWLWPYLENEWID